MCSDTASGTRKRGQVRTDHVKEITKLIEQNRYQYDTYDVFRDCTAAMAYSISNSVDLRHRAEREQKYMDIIGRYDKDTIDTFPKVLAHVVGALEEQPRDVLGSVFGQLELGNTARGQFFTPDDVSKMIAHMQVGDGLQHAIEEKGYVTLHEPAVGAGSMVIAMAEAMRERGLNYQRQLHVTAVDVDERAAHMAYVQFSLLHIPAEVVVGNTLSGEVRDVWHTPAHILDGWDFKLRAHELVHEALDLEQPHEAASIDPSPEQHVQEQRIEEQTIGEQMSLLDFGGFDR